MAKRSNDEWNGELEEEIIEEIKAPELVPLMLMKDLRVKIRGSITGKLYIFGGGGSIVNVDKEDVEKMLTKMSGKCGNCPGSVGSTPYFSIAR